MSVPTKLHKNFPYKTLTPIIGEPTYPAIRKMIQELYANAASSPTSLGGGKHGHVGLVMKPELYKTIANTTFNFPTDPGPSPLYPTTEK